MNLMVGSSVHVKFLNQVRNCFKGTPISAHMALITSYRALREDETGKTPRASAFYESKSRRAALIVRLSSWDVVSLTAVCEQLSSCREKQTVIMRRHYILPGTDNLWMAVTCYYLEIHSVSYFKRFPPGTFYCLF